MNVLVDTTIWSLALRRRPNRLNADETTLVAEWAELVREGRASLLGLVRQEVLSGIAVELEYRRLLHALRAYDDIPVTTTDHERAAADFNRCRSQGIQGSLVDMLIGAVAQRLSLAIFTTDADFGGYVQHLPITLHQVREELRRSRYAAQPTGAAPPSLRSCSVAPTCRGPPAGSGRRAVRSPAPRPSERSGRGWRRTSGRTRPRSGGCPAAGRAPRPRASRPAPPVRG